MHVIVTCKFGKEQMKNSREKVETSFFYHGNQCRVFPRFCISRVPGTLVRIFKGSRSKNQGSLTPEIFLLHIQIKDQNCLNLQYEAGAQFEGDLGEILALGAEISPYFGLREKWESP